MDIDLIFKIVLAIVVVGIGIKIVRTITGMIFKIALILLIILVFYKLFIGV
ncbi:MAG: hypothetical protein ACRC92_15905 [Peptostreptococcaceae bacterium]